MAEPSEFQKDMEAVTARLAQLRQTMDQFMVAMRSVQDVMTFDGHPELLALDDELDTLYRGQL
jgi:prefoldin subunit 5